MTKTEIIEALKVAHKELSMSGAEYAEYANKKYKYIDDYSVTPDTSWAHRAGAVKVQIENILSALEQEFAREGSE